MAPYQWDVLTRESVMLGMSIDFSKARRDTYKASWKVIEDETGRKTLKLVPDPEGELNVINYDSRVMEEILAKVSDE